MKKTIKTAVFSLVLALGLITPLAVSSVSYAQNPIEEACSTSSSGSVLCQNTEGRSVEGVIGIVVNVLLFIVGIVSVIMIIVGGIRFATSGGNAGSVTSAKNTILYAVIGLILAFVAFAIVNWVLQLF